MTEKKINNQKNQIFSLRLIKNSFYTGLALAFVGVTPFTFNFLVARTFGKEALGSVNLVLSFCLLITIFITNFFGSAGNKYLAEYRGSKDHNKFIYVFKIMGLGPIILLSIISLTLSHYWLYLTVKFSFDPSILATIILYIFCRSYYILIRRALYGMDLVKPYTINEIISNLIMLIFLIYFCQTKQYDSLISCYVISYFTFFIFGIIIFIKTYNPLKNLMPISKNFPKQVVLKKFNHYGFVSMIGTVASTGTGYISMIIIGIYLDHADAGLYSSVLSVISILMFIPKLFTQVFLPEFSKLFGEGEKEKISQIFNRTIWYMLFIATILCITVFIFSNHILSVFGKDFVNGNVILLILLPTVFIRILSIPFVSFLSGTKYILYPNIGGVIIFVISLISWLILVPDLKLLGIALGYSIGNFSGISYQILMAILKIRKFKYQ
ncbi:MAG: oligosaccharide flippase family protein [Candidatus Neomarinimicrobiota bacterium]